MVRVGVAGLEQFVEYGRHGLQVGNFLLDDCLFALRQFPGLFAGRAIEGQQLPDLGEGETQFLGTLNELQAGKHTLIIDTVAIGGFGRLVDQADPLVVADRLHADPGRAGDTTNGQRFG